MNGNWLPEYAAWAWLIAGAVMLILETVIPGVLLMWFGTAALVLGTILLMVDMPWPWQFLGFAILSVLSVFVMRRWFAEANQGANVDNGVNTHGSNMIGRTVEVAADIRGGRGRVTIGDTQWSAEGPDIASGQMARIIDVKGTVVVVEPVA